MRTVTGDDVQRMTDGVYLDGKWNGAKASRFWVLLVLAAVIATAGIVADSTATVIGAMIVAPLMTPILGTALGVVLSEHGMLVRSIGYVLGGALVVVLIGASLGLIVSDPSGFAGNTQVSARISPRLIDLLAALATGLVGAFALVRPDISDTLPGVAIAISLVPPLAVVGLLLSVSRYSDALGALLLFGTNVAAIVATGTAVLLAYRVRAAALASGHPVGQLRGITLLAVVGSVALVTVPLAFGSMRVARDQAAQATATPLAEQWAADNSWDITVVSVVDGTVVVTALGPPPEAPVDDLRALLDANGLGDLGLRVNLVVGGTVNYPPASP